MAVALNGVTPLLRLVDSAENDERGTYRTGEIIRPQRRLIHWFR